MSLFYHNYNSVYLEEEGKKRIVKLFKERFCWENETYVITRLAEYGLPVPRILKSSPLENTYSFFDLPLLEESLKENPKRINSALDFLEVLHQLPLKGWHIFDSRKEKMGKIMDYMRAKGIIDSLLLERFRMIIEEYDKPCTSFVHGDFRPANLFYKEGIGGIIDFEFSGVDDPNKDLAYLWVGAVRTQKCLNHYLIEKFQKYKFFSEKAFIFWLTYIHAMILINPRTRSRQDWLKNLQQIVSG